jgi:hypothetical protein
MPPDVRKAFGLPASLLFGFLGCAHFSGAVPVFHYELKTEAQSASAHQAA